MSDNFCRICRGEETPDEPLYYPCKCSGSIKYVHQECLLEWLEHARVRTRCDVCGTDYSLRRRYREDMRSSHPVADYIVFTLRMMQEKYYIIWYTVRGVGMVTTVALVSKYVLEFSVIYAETSRMLSDFHASWEEMQRRIHQSPPRPSLAPMLDTVASFILPASEFRSSWINGMLLLSGFLCGSMLTWFMVIYVLNEEIMDHELDHIEHGEPAHMDRGDDEELIAYFQSNGSSNHLIDGENASNTPNRDPETIVHFQQRDLFEDHRPEIVAQREEDELAGVEDVEDAEDLEVFLRRLIVDLFGGPNAAIFPSFFSILFFFATLAATYPSIYWPSLMLMRMAGTGLAKVLTALKFPPRVVEVVRSSISSRPQTVKGHIALLLLVQGTLATAFRYCILYNLPTLLKKEWGRTLVIFAHRTYAVLKSLLITLIETLVFPEFCGILLHVSVLPITPPLAWHLEQYRHHPHRTFFIQWLSGYIYMHGLQLFVTACRKFFRKGVLFFLHDNDSTALMRSIMILSLPKQLRRICHSAGIYASFILGGIGTTCLLLRLAEPESFPLELSHFAGIQCLRLWPAIIAFRSLSVSLTGSGKQLKNVLTLWVRERIWLRMFNFITHQLDLESWFFSTPRTLTVKEASKLSELDGSLGYFVRAPVELPLLPHKNLNLFVPVTKDNVRLDGKTGVQANELSKYTLVWRPRRFQLRIAALALFSWAFISLLTLMFTLIPLKLGRVVDAAFLNSSIKNDVILMATGMSICFPLYAELLRRFPPPELARCVRFTNITGNLPSLLSSGASVRRSIAWAAVFVSLSYAPSSDWSHWHFFQGRSDDFNVQLLSATLNMLLFTLVNLASLAWCRAIATADCMVWQSALELLGLAPRSDGKVFFTSSVLAIYHLWSVWRSSKRAKTLSDFVRETLYLEAIEVQNYEANQDS